VDTVLKQLAGGLVVLGEEAASQTELYTTTRKKVRINTKHAW